MKPGLVSITFRQLQPAQIVRACEEAGLGLIEWGGDVHVPHGDLAQARAVRELTRNSGLEVAAYGSYLKLGSAELSVEAVLDTAAELGAPVVRVWAGTRGSEEATEDDWRRVVEAARRAAEAASARGLRIAYEFHRGTLTDSKLSALQLLEKTNHPCIRCLWQPPIGSTDEQALDSLHAILPRLEHLHVFHWQPDFSNRRPLAEGSERWLKFLRAIATAGQSPALLLEFVPGNDPAILAREASTLRYLIKKVLETSRE